MSRTHVFALSGLLFLAAAVMTTPARAEIRRYAVVIGANVGDPQDARLHFAEADAAKVAHTLRSVGDFPAGQTLQMNGVSADEVRRSLIELNARLRQEMADSVLLVYYSGHADAENLHLGGTHLDKAVVSGPPIPEWRRHSRFWSFCICRPAGMAAAGRRSRYDHTGQGV